jgi:GTP-binding protein HflX
MTAGDPRERAYLIAVDSGDDAGWSAEESLGELSALVEAAGAEVVGMAAQHRESMHPVWYLGKGKAEELKSAKGATRFSLLVADDELSPKQQRSLEELLDVKVLDRSGVILDIFAQRAHTHEGRIQVELAQLEYQLPRLTRLWTHLSRTGGGIGTRGPGETQLETDRRVIRQRIKKTRERVDEVRRRRETAARARDRRLLPTVAIVGYTNAGKSTLLNALVGEEAAAVEDMLFATLDPTTRRVRLGEGQTVIVSDTVGFIHKLPHQLVEAFQATLEEVTRADALLEVVDLADRHAAEHRRTVQTVLDELGAGHKPRIVVLNKADLADALPNTPFVHAGVMAQRGAGNRRAPSAQTGAGAQAGVLSQGGVIRRADQHLLRVSALTGMGIGDLRAQIALVLGELWLEVDVAVPYSAGDLLSRVRERGSVAFEYRDEDVRMYGRVPPSMAGELQRTALSWERALRARGRENKGGDQMAEELLTAGKIAEKLGVSAGKVTKAIKEKGLEPDQKKGNCGYFGPAKVEEIAAALKTK